MPRAQDPASAGDDASRGEHGQDQSRAGGQFAAGMPLDAAAAGASLAAALAGTRAGLAGLSDDALAGFLGGCQKIAAWSAGMLMEGIAEHARRRPDDRTPGRAALYAAAAKTAQAAQTAAEPADPPPYDEFTPDELMPVLRLSKGGALRQVELAVMLRYRLRATLAAMLDGRIDIVRARIIAEATADLSPADAAKVEALVLGLAGRQTYTALGIALGKAVLQADPAAAIRRRKKAEKRARVERWREYDGTGALAGRNLPPDDTVAADQALTDQAMELREAGLDGPLDYLRATALIDRIIGRDSRPAPDQDTPDQDGPDQDGPDQDGPDQDRPETADPDEQDWDDRDDWPGRDQYLLDQYQAESRGQDNGGCGAGGQDTGGQDTGGQDDQGQGDGPGGTRRPDRPGGPKRPGGPRRPGGSGKNRRKRPRKRIAAQINLTIPLTTYLELDDAPGDAGPFGPLDPAAARDLARTAAAHPRSRWCITVTGQDGQAVAHGCARGPRPWAALTPRAEPGPRTAPGARDGPENANSDPRALIAQFLAGLGIKLSPIATTCCDHHDAEPGYTPSRKLRHKIHARTPTCSYWGCRRPAAKCDDDHTIAWDSGGLSCECNLSPLCRRHHRMKQREGWTLTQPQPGIMIWQTPSGRRYRTTPARYTA
jgi:hypothetical protein